MFFEKYEGKEANLQKISAKYLDSLPGLLWFHTPNGGSRNIKEAAELKRQGVKAGVPDILIIEQKNNYSGLAIELKVKGGKQTASQKEFEKKLTNKGFLYRIVYSLDELIYLVNKYLKNEQ